MSVNDLFFWFERDWLAVSGRPGRRREASDPGAAVRAWLQYARRMGIQSIICLLTRKELDRHYVRHGLDLLQTLREADFQVSHCPVATGQKPPLTGSEVRRAWRRCRALPRPWLIHCNAGVRRGPYIARLLRVLVSEPSVEPEPPLSAPTTPTAPMTSPACRQQQLILIRYQDETNYGRVDAWQDHAGSMHKSSSGRNSPWRPQRPSKCCASAKRFCCRPCSGPPSNKPPPFWAWVVRPWRGSRRPSARPRRRNSVWRVTGADGGNPCSPRRRRARS